MHHHDPRPQHPPIKARPAGRCPGPSPFTVLAALLVAILALLAVAPPTGAMDFRDEDLERIAQLPKPYQDWLRDVELIMTEEELEAFLELGKDYQRDAFIKTFWRVRDKYQDTARNEFKERYEQRLQMVRQSFADMEEDRARILLINGFPTARIEARCVGVVQPLEVWYYAGSDQLRREFFLVFVQEGTRYNLWRPYEGIGRLRNNLIGPGGFDNDVGAFLQELISRCRDGEKLAAGIAWVLQEGDLYYGQILGQAQETPDLERSEWVATFNAYTTELPDGAATLPGELKISYPGRRQARTALLGNVAIPRQAATPAALGDYRSYNLVLTGEVLREGELFDNFRYKFDLPAAEVQSSEDLPLVFQRFLRPGDYTLVLRVEDVNGQAYYREERPLSVPKVEKGLPPPPQDEETARLLAEANAALSRGETTLQLIEPQGQLKTGYVRFDTLTTGDDIARVTFALDGDPLLIKRSPPYSVDLDLGPVPRPRTLTAIARNEADEEVARDELLLNAGGHRFRVRLVEPHTGRTYRRSLSAEAEVEVPEGQSVERVEIFLNETRVATLYQEPWVQPVVLPEESAIAYVRAVAYLPDGNSTEDLVFVNAPDYLEEIDVQMVELYATVTGRDGRPIEDGFRKEDFTVREEGVPQEVVRFERVRDLPIHAGILLDVSASMEESLDEAQQAALEFFQQAVEPKDRAAVITFNDHPNLAVKFTNDVNELAGGLAGLKAERGTALYDSVIFGLYYFNGIKGQRALLVLSDGKDESSRFTWEQTLEYARRAGVTIYSVALRDDDAHKRLSRLAEITGGRSYKVEDPAELGPIYEAIQRELRSKYLLAYQSNNTSDSKDFRSIEVKVDRSGADVKTMQGYYP